MSHTQTTPIDYNSNGNLWKIYHRLFHGEWWCRELGRLITYRYYYYYFSESDEAPLNIDLWNGYALNVWTLSVER